MGFMKRTTAIVGGLIVSGGIGVGIAAARFEATLPPGAKVGEVEVGGLKPEEAVEKLKKWWGARQMDLVTLTAKDFGKTIEPRKPAAWGLVLDASASVSQLRLDQFSASVARTVGLGNDAPAVEFVWTVDNQKLGELKKWVDANRQPNRPARVTFEKGKIKTVKEVAGVTLNVEAMKDILIAATMGDGAGELPLTEAPKRVPDEALAKIKGVVSTYRTTFPAGNRPRCTNIEVASGNINGEILMPGDIFSYNKSVGQRTVARGFREAGIYVSGRHDTGVGGGICQVSSTLYNAALLGDFKIVERRNHSLPVAYVPVGRDATVDWGNIDFRFQNNYDFPVAIAMEYTRGALTTRILGVPDPTLKVTFAQSGRRYWGQSVKYVRDSSLPAGRQVVQEKGGAGQAVTTHRIVYRNGKQVKRESLGQSSYSGGPRIVRVGTRAAAPSASPPASPPVTSPTE
jgi:vancomycin resistance protein YoaR